MRDIQDLESKCSRLSHSHNEPQHFPNPIFYCSYAEGDATISKFKAPAAIAIHGEQTHSTIYVADAQEHRIRRIFRDEYSRCKCSL